MKKHLILLGLMAALMIPAAGFAAPTVFPTGTTIYNPEKCWNGYTVFGPVEDNRENSEGGGTVLIDMNGNVVHEWPLHFYPAKVLPDGNVIGGHLKEGEHLFHMDPNIPTAQSQLGFDLVQMDFNGNIVWKFDKKEMVKNVGKGTSGKEYWCARQHHDFQREGSPTGYYAPGLKPKTKAGKTLILSERGKLGLLDSGVYEVSWDGKVIWEWWAVDHIQEFLQKIGGIEKFALGGLRQTGGKHPTIRVINTASYLGPNKWHDQGDERFLPDNIICDNTAGEVIFIISRKTGEIVWWVGPDYSEDPELKHLGYLHHQEPFYTGGMLHNAHMIPKGLPGEGNILVFNNGKPFSTVTEFNPITKKLVWEYSPARMGHAPTHSLATQILFSGAESNAQRLPNGNTLITEADMGRIFEVTKDYETVWEYVNPRYWYKFRAVWSKAMSRNMYRAYRIPYDWVPQIKKPVEEEIVPPDNAEFRILPKSKRTKK
jgi:hypothetical protein